MFDRAVRPLVQRSRRCQATVPVEPLERRQLLSVSLASQSTGGVAAEAPGAGAIGAAILAPAVSDDGRFVVFASEAGNLVAGDANGAPDVFVRDRQTGETRLVSAAADGAGPGNGTSGELGGETARAGYAISGNGRYVVFTSSATNLVAGQTDSNNLPDYFVRDLENNTTALVTATPGGGYSASSAGVGVAGRPAISDDGRFIAFASTYADLDASVTTDADDNAVDVFVRDTSNNTTRQLTKTFDGSVGAGAAGANPTISSDGRAVAFSSNDKLAAGGPDFLFEQVWVYDTTSNAVANASLTPGGAYAGGDSAMPQISGDGRSVAFLSAATDLVTGFTDNNGEGITAPDIFLRDLDTSATTLVSRDVSVATDGGTDTSGTPSISADGRFVAFISRSKNLVGGVTDNNDQDGQFGGEDVFQFDATSGTNKMLSVNAAGTAAGGMASSDFDADPDRGPAMSDDGRFVVFPSTADDLVDSDENTLIELFVRDTQANTTRRVYGDIQLPDGGGDVSATGTAPAISGDGAVTAFVGNGFGVVGNEAIGQQVFVDATAGDGGQTPTPTPTPTPPVEEEPGTLAPRIFATLPAAAIAGGRVKGASAIVSITNVAETAYNGPVTVKLFTSLDGTFQSDADAEVTTVTKRLRIDPADTKDVRVKINSLPAVADGEYVLIAQVSGTGVAPGNNASDEPVTIAAPFVELSGSFAGGAIPATITKGKRARLSVVVTNAGNTDARGTLPVSLAISTDPSGANPTLLATANAKLSLKAGTGKALKLNFTVPAEAPTGPFFIVATLDPANVLPERDETGNNVVISGTSVTIA